MTDEVAGVEVAEPNNDRLENAGLEFDGLENDGLHIGSDTYSKLRLKSKTIVSRATV